MTPSATLPERPTPTSCTSSTSQIFRNDVATLTFPSSLPGRESVTQADPHSPTGTTKFVCICIARRNKGLGSTFILRNVINGVGVGVEMMYELYSPAIREIEVLKLERRRRAKLYYLRDKSLKY